MTTRIVHLFVFETMADGEAAFAVSAINNPRLQSVPGSYRVVTAAATLAPVTTMGGVRMQPDVSLDSVNPDSSAMLILPGGLAWDAGANQEALQLASRFITSGSPVTATCAATLALARAGLLDRLRLTGSAREYLISSGFRGAGFYCGTPPQDQGISATDTAAPIDFAREIFRMLNLNSTASSGAWYDAFIHGNPSNLCALARN